MSLRKVVVASHCQVVVRVMAEHLCSSVIRVVPDVIEGEIVFRANVVINAEGEVVLGRGAAEDRRAVVVGAVDGCCHHGRVLEKNERLRTEQVGIDLIVGEGQARDGVFECDERARGVLQAREVSIGHLVRGGNRKPRRRSAIHRGPRLPVEEEEALAVAVICMRYVNRAANVSTV